MFVIYVYVVAVTINGEKAMHLKESRSAICEILERRKGTEKCHNYSIIPKIRCNL